MVEGEDSFSVSDSEVTAVTDEAGFSVAVTVDMTGRRIGETVLSTE